MAERDEDVWQPLRAIFSLIADFWSFVLFSWLAPRTNHVEKEPEAAEDRSVNSLAEDGERAEHPLESAEEARHLEIRSVEGMVTGREGHVSDEFLTQLEQRTQQLKITLANLEAEKVRIEGLIAQLQPLVPHYDALLAAERQITEANISLEPASRQAEDAPPAESSGWASDAPDGPAGSGWSGSWNT
jgi:hypothetical protein